MTTSVNVRQAGWLTLVLGAILLVMGAAAWTAPVRADEPATELTAEERGTLHKQALELLTDAQRSKLPLSVFALFSGLIAS
ncbi:MAG TPA: hypothetical protein DDY78_27045 [Planctomycetales bacterium]|jgi:hypothetical protein|nr:hypothetical protein [Planctomycetales bacterium]